MDAGKPFHARNRATLQKHFEGFGCSVHAGVHPVQRIVAGVSKDLAALLALVALPILALPEFSAFGSAIVAGHVDLNLSSGRVHNGRGTQKSLPCGFGPRLNPAGSDNYQRGVVITKRPRLDLDQHPPGANQALFPVELRGRIKSLFLWFHRQCVHSSRCQTNTLGRPQDHMGAFVHGLSGTVINPDNITVWLDGKRFNIVCIVAIGLSPFRSNPLSRRRSLT